MFLSVHHDPLLLPMKATEEVSVVFNSNLLLMGRGAGVGGGPGEKSVQVVLYEFGVVVLSCLFVFNNFILGECHFFLFSENAEVHTHLVIQNTQSHKFSCEYRTHLLNV